MSWVTIIWSMVASACLTMAAMHWLVWYKQRTEWANLLFAVTAMSTAIFVGTELWMMRAETPADLGTAVRWAHVPIWLGLVALVGFVWLYLRAGRAWLGWSFVGLRTLSLLLDFLTGQNLNYREISAVRRIPFLGEPVSIAIGVPNPWMLVGQLSSLAFILFVADASVTVWRRGDRRKALLVGGSTVFFVLGGQVQSLLVFWGIVQMPIMVSLFYLGIVTAMGHELSRDVIRAAQLARELRESEKRMELAASAADLGLWAWDIVSNEIWATDQARSLFGFTKSEPIDFDRFLQALHPSDREPVTHALAKSMNSDGEYENEHHVVLPHCPARWIASRGRVEFNRDGKPILLRGVSLDITERKRAEQEALQQRSEMAHLSRVTMLGELSGSLAHELNQPLGAILRNTEAAELFLQEPSPDLEELRAILVDIRNDDQRAGAVIDRMRSLLNRREVEHSLLDLNLLVSEVIGLVRPDADSRKVRLVLDPGSSIPPVRGDRVQLQQVLLNLLLNAMDAVNDSAPDRRRVIVRIQPAGTLVEVTVSDNGHGIAPEKLARLFEPFFTTKANGMGMGLPISRRIMEAHLGSIRAENDPAGGATFRFTLPVAKEESAS